MSKITNEDRAVAIDYVLATINDHFTDEHPEIKRLINQLERRRTALRNPPAPRTPKPKAALAVVTDAPQAVYKNSKERRGRYGK